ncbi:P-loop containing nucleoside triphosphate hydrolase [Sesbania bispinosa]|nr:P-loop containing nucleoside triphosphate hydrolase [Sesbania bispinosa]
MWYILYYKGNVERLKPEVQTLKGNKDSVQHYADQAKRNGEEIENNVQNWLNKVDVIVAEAEKLIDSEDHAKAECCTGHFPNLWTRHQLSRKIKKMTQEISKVLVEGKFDRISYRPASQVTVTPFGRGYEALDSRTSMLNEIMQASKDTNLYIIGVYGMGGVGKTTLVKGQIADALDLTFNKETKEGRARQLSQRISKEKSILVILDDIWGKLDLTEVGIPFGDDHKGCKLVVTSRDLNVLNSEMGIQKEFRLEVLHVEDSWNLFEKMAVTVAKALRKKDASYWNSTLNELKRAQPTYAVQRHTEIKQWPKIDQLQKCHFISMPDSYIHELPEKLACPELKLLSLLNAGKHLNVPENFFSRMKEVKVMEFRRMMFTPSLPLSLSLLTKLRSLELSECVLEDISMVGELKSLEILGLERSDIKELPKEIGQLANLRMLNLTRCSKLRFIPTNLISSLTCLEELYMGNCSIQWDVKGIDGKSNHASIDELRNLSQLTTLDIMIQDASVLPRDLLQVLANLERYNIYIGDNWKWSSKWSTEASESSKTLKLMQKSTSNLLDNGFNLLLNVSEDISFAGLQSVRDVLYDLNKEGFPQLKHLQIQCSAELKYILNSMARVHLDPAFPNLETLALQNLVNLEEICHGPIPKILLQNYKISKLKIIDKKTPEIDEVMDMITFPKLHSLTLECLPSLVSFCPMPKTTYTQSLELFDQKGGMPCLETLTLSMINSCKLWDGKLHGHSCIQNLRTLTIDNCGSISYVFSPSVARELVNLQCLKISNCQKLEEIVVLDEKLGNTSSDQKSFSNEEVIFPNLETLVIPNIRELILNSKDVTKLRNSQLSDDLIHTVKALQLRCFHDESDKFPSGFFQRFINLEKLKVTCSSFTEIFSSESFGRGPFETTMKLRSLILVQLNNLKFICEDKSEMQPILQNLESLNVYRCSRLKIIVPSWMLFQNLEELWVQGCAGLENIITPAAATSVLKLRKLWIINCEKIEEIVASDDDNDACDLAFMKLEYLELRSLPRLRSFCKGSYNFKFPLLEKLYVVNCHMMETFSYGALSAPQLREVLRD